MKILHVIDSAGIYGKEIMLLNLIKEQIEMGLTPFLGSITNLAASEKPLEIEGRTRGFRVIRFSARNSCLLAGALRLVRFAIDQKIDLFHSHGYKSNIILGFLPRRIRKIPVVSTLHGWTSIRIFCKMGLYEFLDTLCLRRIDAVVKVVSDFSLSGRSIFLRDVKKFVVENGIPELTFDLNPVIQQDPETVKFSENGFVIGAIGRLSEEKGLSYLIDAISLLLRNKKDYRAIIIGEGRERIKLERRIKKRGLSHRIVLIGHRENANQYLPLFDVFVLPSLTEGLPITLLEAMQAQIPIVASRVGGVPAVLGNGHYGLLVDPRNPRGLAEAISSLRENPDKAQEMAQRAKDFALTKYSSRRMAEHYSEIYEWVVKKTKGN